MKKFNMKGFEYKDGNSISFNSVFGKVTLTYMVETDAFVKFFEKDKAETKTYFKAELLSHANIKSFGEGLTEDSALIDLYQNHAKFRALCDLGII